MKIKYYGLIMLVVLMGLAGCAPKEMVQVDLASFNENPDEYKDKRPIIKTDIDTLLKNPDFFDRKEVMLSGFVKTVNPPWIYWEFKLVDDQGQMVGCYETNYRDTPWVWAENTVRRAQYYNEKISIVGVFKKSDHVELDWIEFRGKIVDTDFTPPHIPYPYYWP